MSLLVLEIDPALLPTAQQKGCRVFAGRPIFYEKKRVKEARQRIVEEIWANGCGTITAEAYRVEITYFYHLASEKETPRGKPKTTRPDVDNLTKLMLDAITDSGIAWKDDSQVTTLILSKRKNRQGVPPCIAVQIFPEAEEI